MSLLARVLPAAAGVLLGVTASLGQTETLPPLFNPKTAPAIPETPAPKPRVAIAPPTRARLNVATDHLLASARVFEAPVATSVPVPADASEEKAVQMERMIVQERAIRPSERRMPDPPLLDFLKTGYFYRNPDAARGGLSHVKLNLLILKQPGLGWGREFTRGEIEFNFRW